MPLDRSSYAQQLRVLRHRSPVAQQRRKVRRVHHAVLIEIRNWRIHEAPEVEEQCQVRRAHDAVEVHVAAVEFATVEVTIGVLVVGASGDVAGVDGAAVVAIEERVVCDVAGIETRVCVAIEAWI